MRKLLVFDADNSLESLGNKDDQMRMLGTKPVKCPSLHDLKAMLTSLASWQNKKIEHEMFEEEDSGTELVISFNEKAKKNGLWGIAIDTLSHMSTTSTSRIITEVHGRADFFPVDRGVWGTLSQIGTGILNGFKHASFPIIVNCHVKEEDGPTSQILVPDVSGSTRNRIPQVFDFVFYADKKTKDGVTTWSWITEGNNRLPYAKVRNPEARKLIAPEIDQDFSFVLNVCEECNIENPKILILANSNYGKSSSLATVNGFYPPEFTKKELITNGKAN